MQQWENFLISVEEKTAIVSFNRPKALNALNYPVLKDLNEILDVLAADDSVYTVILTGAGDKAFIAGGDIKDMSAMNVEEGKLYAYAGTALLRKIEELEKPVIAAVNGYALGGGTEVAMACDIRIASERAVFGQPEVGLGIIPGFAGTQRLPRLVGRGAAKLLIFTGKNIKADEALRIGLCEAVVPHAELLDYCKKLAADINKNGPTSVRLAKAAINHGLDMDLRSGCRFESFVFGHCFATEDHGEGTRAFVEKRKASFTGKYKK
jgi:enoyl-CoA hydratase